MEISARNIWKGKVKSINTGEVAAEVVVEIAPGVEAVAFITKASVDKLGVEIGKEVVVAVKATEVMIGKP